MTYWQGMAVVVLFVIAFAGAGVAFALLSGSEVAIAVVAAAALLGIILGYRTRGRPPSENAKGMALVRLTIPIVVIGGMFVLPALSKIWPGAVYGGLAAACAVISGYLPGFAIRNRRPPPART